MATLAQLTQPAEVRQHRYFSEAFKQQKVQEIEKGLSTIAEITKVYAVSKTAVYKWVYKYSLLRKKSVKMVVEAQSDTARIQALQQHVQELEQKLGQKQFQMEFLEKQLELASQYYGVDLKKKPFCPPSSGSGSTETNIPTP